MTLDSRHYTIDGDVIIVDRSELQRWFEHFKHICEIVHTDSMKAYNAGRADILGDILRLFELREINAVKCPECGDVIEWNDETTLKCPNCQCLCEPHAVINKSEIKAVAAKLD